MASESFHHRSNYGTKRKAHKVPGKSKASSDSQSFGRVDPESKERKFQNNAFRDIGKAQRKATAKLKRKAQRDELLATKSRYYGKMAGGTPKIVALLALSPYSNTAKVRKHLLRHCGGQPSDGALDECQASLGAQKANFVIFECRRDDTLSVFDICKVADVVLLVCSPSPSPLGMGSACLLGLDERSKLLCSLIQNVGGGSGTTVFGLYQPRGHSAAALLRSGKNSKAQQCKVDPLIRTSFSSFLSHQFGGSNHAKGMRILHCYDTAQLFRFMHSAKGGGYHDANARHCEWKQKRPHLLAQRIADYDAHSKIVALDGYLRGSAKLNVNGAVHITGFGDFLLSEVRGVLPADHGDGGADADADGDEAMADSVSRGVSRSVALVQASSERPSELRALEELDGLAAQLDQTIITETELAEIEQERKKRAETHRLQKLGLTDYGKEWTLFDDDDEDGSDDEAVDDDVDIDEQQGKEEEEDEEEDFSFADEVDTPLDVRAKDEFSAYRGLQQFYNGKWDKMELLPVEYARIANITDWRRAVKRTKLENILSAQSKSEAQSKSDCVECGRKVRILINGVDEAMFARLSSHLSAGKPLLVWALLTHEHKVSVCNFVVQRHAGSLTPLHCDTVYTFDVGFRRFRGCAVFSEHSRGNKHLVKRAVDDDAFAVASVYAPISFPPLGVLMFADEREEKEKEMDESAHLSLCAKGSLLSVDAHRLLIGRKVLTGSAMRVQRRRAVVRHMFHNADDVRYFAPIDLWTRNGLKGRIEEPIGDKGNMKCFFNGHVKQSDTICLSLYKRVFPAKEKNDSFLSG